MASQSAKHSGLGSDYADLSGDALLDKLSESGEVATLEAFWRYGDPRVSATAIAPILRTEAPHLLEMVVEQVFAPSLPEPFPSHLTAALDKHRPQLPPSLADRLSERLRDPEPLSNPQMEGSRHLFEMWILNQDGKIGEDFAIGVVSGRTPRAGTDSVRHSAFRRCRAGGRILAEAGTIVAKSLEDAPSATTWESAAEFVEGTCQEASVAPGPVIPVIERLLELAPQHCPTESFAEHLARLATQLGVSLVEEWLRQPLPNAPGSRALLRLLPGFRRAAERSALFAQAVRTQPNLWAAVQGQLSSWDDSEWKRNLRALIGDAQIDRSILIHLLNSAPLTVTAIAVELALSQSSGPEDQPITVATERLRERLSELGAGKETRRPWVEAVHWPRAKDETALSKLAALFSGLEAGVHVRLVVRGFLEGKIGSQTAGFLLPEQGTHQALKLMGAGEGRAKLAEGLALVRSEELEEAATEIQAEVFAFDLARALAPVLPNAAFSGSAGAFPTLSKGDKGELIDLLVVHGTQAQIPVLETIVGDDHRENSERRVKAAGKIAVLTPKGHALPQCVVDLLRSNIPKLREATVRAIEQVKPRDPDLIGGLHAVVDGGGVPGKAAAAALDSLANEFLADLANASNKEEIHEIIPLLGAVGRAQVLGSLFNYLGANAEYDDVALHRAAAEALRRAAEHVKHVTEEDQETLVGLIDGEEREADPQAQSALSSALARLQLGDDAALKILYDEVPFEVKDDPDELFGPEKERLVRQLGLYARARDQGESGWGLALTHLDNVAERLIRSAYLICEGASESIREEIRTDPSQPEYGRLIGALSSIRELKSIQDDASVLHDIRSKQSEVPHPGERPDEETTSTARRCFKEIAKVSVGTLQNRRRQSGE